MRQILNTLYVTTEPSYIHLDHETLRVEVEGTTQLRVPLHHLGGIVCFGNVLVSPAIIRRSAEEGRFLVFLSREGRFVARVEGATTGNVLLRRAQHAALSNVSIVTCISRNIVAAKIQNARQVILRGIRESADPTDAKALEDVAKRFAGTLMRLKSADDLDSIRGLEGEAARSYFGVFDLMVKQDRQGFRFEKRTRRPPLDRMNALLSFLYTLLRNDCVAAAEGVGLDPQVGFLHALRPGRPALGLDLMEEFRPVFSDRLALSLINRKQITRKDFLERPGGAIHLNDKGRKTVIIAYQKRKQREVFHAVTDTKVPLGLIPHLQSRLLARHLREDLPEYVPFLYR